MKRNILLIVILFGALFTANAAQRTFLDSLISFDWTIGGGYSGPSVDSENGAIYPTLPIMVKGQLGVMLSLFGVGVECSIAGSSNNSHYLFPALFYVGLQDFVLFKYGHTFSTENVRSYESSDEYLIIDTTKSFFNTYGFEIILISFIIDSIQIGLNLDILFMDSNNEAGESQKAAYGGIILTVSNKPRNKYFTRQGAGLFFL